MIRRVRRILARIGPTSVDQAISSLSNLLASVIAARLLPPSDFGAFGLIMASYFISIALCRALSGDTLLITADKTSHAITHTVTLWTGVIAGTAFGLVLAIVGVFLHSEIGVAFIVLGALFPTLALQDTVRYVGFQRKRARVALLADSIWLVLMLLGVPVLLHFGASIPGVTALWAAAGGVAGIIALFALRPQRATPLDVRSAVRTNAKTMASVFADQAFIAISQQGVVYIIAGFVGLVGNAGYRGAQVILGPISIITMGISVVAVPHLRSVWVDRPAALVRSAAMVALANAAFVTLLTQALAFLPTPVGEAVLGDSWSFAQQLLPWLGLVFTGQAINFGAITGFRVMGKADKALWIRLTVVPVTLASVAVAASTGDMQLVVQVQAACSILSAALWWLAFRRTARGASGSSSTAPAAA